MNENYHIRWMIRKDMPEVLSIERDSFNDPWRAEEFIRVLEHRNCIGMVAEFEEQVVGFMIYTLHKERLGLLNFAVHPDFRLRYVGSAMVRYLIDGKLSVKRRKRITLEVRESNLDAQLFFRNQGFRYVKTVKNLYTNTPEDAYLLAYRLPAKAIDITTSDRFQLQGKLL